MKRKPAIAVIGSYAVGLTMRADRFPTAGETLRGSHFKQFHGGKGSNQAVACARLGADVSLIACIGRDSFGENAMELYRNEGVDTRYMRMSDSMPTGAGFIMVDNGGSNEILIDFGANNDLSPEYIEGIRHAISYSEVVLLQMEIPPETVKTAAGIASSLGKTVIINPAPYQPLPDEAWRYATVVTPNEKEARLLLGYRPDEKISLEELGKGLLNKGIKIAVITLGEKGAFIVSEDFSMLVPSRKAEVVDTTGAGDTFTAALGVALAEGKDIRAAAAFAACAAALSVTKYGVIESLPYRNEVDGLLIS